ncbi:MAG: hypothetical protein EZS28_015195 [Streblomastix strix]|uniref:Uncharacterized protein n=1 Tax=Streblomastix strix TaxID=222440 RepID=A0A5J4W3X3_9EUKA|nr:MAG: hypothetical protein EZS28_015195 [Streblomastix strix]
MSYIKGKSKLGQRCNELKEGDEVRVIVDLQSNPHTFCLLFFGIKDSVWEFISLEKLAQGVDTSIFEEKRRFKYE